MTVAFVLQGGASLAAAQVGMLRALHDEGIRPDIVVGTSAGALNAVAFAQNPTRTGLDELGQLWGRVRRRDVFPLRPATAIAGLLGRSDNLVSAAPLRSWLVRGVDIDRLEDAVVPVSVVATDAVSGAAVVLSTGSAIQALLASSAVPGVYAAVEIDGRHLVDGGVAADLPVLAAESLGATVSYVLPRARTAARNGALHALARTTNQLLERTSASDIAAARHEVHILPAPVTKATSPFDFRFSAALMHDGYASARSWLARNLAPVPPVRAIPVSRTQSHRLAA
jgi:NTE family protein